MTQPPPRTYADAMAVLARSQKTSKGAPAYSRFVNRRMGRHLAALAYVAGLTPNQVTAVSALCTFTGVALVALAPPTVLVSVAVAVLLLLGYSLDAADGQLARLRGGGSAAGEWLDHVVDAVKIAVMHTAVLVCWYRHYDLDPWVLLVPLAYQVAETVFFFAMILTDRLRRTHRGQSGMILQGQGSSSLAYSLAVLPTDYGVLCLSFALLWWPPGFITVYTALTVGHLGFLALALPKWFREVRAMDSAARVVGPVPSSTG